MGFVEAIKKALRRGDASETRGRAPQAHISEGEMGEDLVVPEVTSTELRAEMVNGGGDHLLLLDIRENFERAQAHIPNSLHIPMNSLPNRLAELDRERDIVVYCAHGHRSFGVTGWLIQQDYKARSLKGGIVDWQLKQGPIERGYSGKAG